MEEMLSLKPTGNKATTGTMSIRARKEFRQFPIQFDIEATPTNFLSRYSATLTNFVVQIEVLHAEGQPNIYYQKSYAPGSNGVSRTGATRELIQGDGIFAPFAGSDFSIADLGLEFLHWPDQHLLQKEMKRSRSCRVLESINPHPASGGYSRVKSWVDLESDGIVQAVAYDVNGKELKQFFPKDFSKGEDGQWQLEEMQISNSQTGSTTTVKFNVDR